MMQLDADEAISRAYRRRIRVALLLLLALSLATVAVWWFAVGRAMPLPGFGLSTDEVVAEIRSWGAWSAVASIILMILHSFIPFPAEIVAIANGILFGAFWGSVITWVGAMLGAALAFALSRWLGRPFVEAMVNPRQCARLDAWVARQGTGALLFSRFVPVISFNLINYAAGLTAISWWTFLWATGLGILPLTVAMVVMGDQILSGDTAMWLWFGLGGLAVWLLWWWTRRVMRRRGAAMAPVTRRPS
jgi:uncharacterized membrane protein YdjX (TVP38/TMEM64 family)